MNRRVLTTTVVFLAITVFGLFAHAPKTLASSHAPAAAQTDPCNKSSGFLGLPTWYKYLKFEEVNGKCEITEPYHPGTTDLNWTEASGRVGLAIAEILLRIAGLVSVGFIIFGGFSYLLSQGEPERTKKAKGTILNALIGLVIAMLAVTIVNFIAGNLWK